MRTATMRELRNHSASVMKWVAAGEEVKISKHGKIVARLVPENPRKPKIVDWSKSAAVTRDKSQLTFITDEQRAEILDYNKGRW